MIEESGVPPCSVVGRVLGAKMAVRREGDRIVFFVLVQLESGKVEYRLPMEAEEAHKFHQNFTTELTRLQEARRMIA